MTEFSTIHQRLFLSRNSLLLACVRSLLRDGGGDGFLGIAKSAPGTGCCWLCNMNVEEDRRGGVRKTVCAARREKRRETSARCPVKSQGVVVVLVPYYDSQCFSWPLRNFSFFSFFLFFILYYLRYTRLYIYTYYTARCKSNIFQLENIALFTTQFIFASEKKVTQK